jgi:hypothetical protein
VLTAGFAGSRGSANSRTSAPTSAAASGLLALSTTVNSSRSGPTTLCDDTITGISSDEAVT